MPRRAAAPTATQFRFAIQATGPMRTEPFMGREHKVFPAVLVREQVLHNNLGRTFLPREEIAASVNAWNGTPVVERHPSSQGRPISARTPAVMNKTGIGFLFNARCEDGALKADVYLDPSRIDALPDIANAVANVVNGQACELSTGFVAMKEATSGTFDGKEYDMILRELQPDHLAILPDEIGACNVNDGCGLGVNAGTPGVKDRLVNGVLALINSIGAADTGNAAAVCSSCGADMADGKCSTDATHVQAENRVGSDQDFRELLSEELSEAFGGLGKYLWIDSVFSEESAVVFELDSQAGGRALYRVDYTEGEDGSITFGDPAPVRRVTTFVPAANAGSASADAGTGAGTPNAGDRSAPSPDTETLTMNRDQLIAQLIANGNKLPKESLALLSDCELKALAGIKETPAANANAGARVDLSSAPDSEAWNRVRELNAENEALRRTFEPAANHIQKSRAEFIESLLCANAKHDWSDEEIQNATLPQLQKMHTAVFGKDHQSAPRSFAGRGGPVGNTSGGPSFNFVQPILGGARGESALDLKELN